MAVRSELLVPPVVLGLATATIGTVPVGHTWILKYLTVVNGNVTTSALVDLYLRFSGVDRPVRYKWSVSNDSDRHDDLWIVVPEGIEVRAKATNTSCTLTLSGADLLGVST